MSVIKASNFNTRTLKAQTKNQTHQPPAVAQGICNLRGTDGGASNVKNVAMQKKLIDAGLLDNNSMPNTRVNASLITLNALCITMEKDFDPHFSLLRNNPIKINNPNIQNPELYKQRKTKTDGEDMFPQLSDPWHEHDEGPPRYLDPPNDSYESKISYINPSPIVNQIYNFNMHQRVPDNAKLKQFMYDQTPGGEY